MSLRQTQWSRGEKRPRTGPKVHFVQPQWDGWTACTISSPNLIATEDPKGVTCGTCLRWIRFNPNT